MADYLKIFKRGKKGVEMEINPPIGLIVKVVIFLVLAALFIWAVMNQATIFAPG